MIGATIWFLATFLGVYYLVRKFLESISINNPHEKSILITGCDSGFGHSLALKCLINKMKVFAACLTEEVFFN